MLGILRSYSDVKIPWSVQPAFKCFGELVAGIHVSAHAKGLYPGWKNGSAAAIAKSPKKIKSILARHLLFCTKISLFWALERNGGMRSKALVLCYQKKWFILFPAIPIRSLCCGNHDNLVLLHGKFRTISRIFSQPVQLSLRYPAFVYRPVFPSFLARKNGGLRSQSF